MVRNVTLLLLVTYPSFVSAQPGQANGFDMGEPYSNQQPEAFSDASSQFPVEGQDQGSRNPYPKYQFKNAGASKIIVPNLSVGSDVVEVPTKAEAPAPAAQGESPESAPVANPAAAAAGDASYYQEIISKVKAQGEAGSSTQKEQSSVSEYKF